MRLLIGIGTLLVAALATSTVSAATTVTTNAAHEITYDIPAGETFTNDKGFSSAITKVVKTGPGTLAVTVSSTAFRGHDVEINGGYVKVSAVDALGQNSTIKVAGGAALWFTGANPGQSTSAFTGCTVEIAGDGPDHLGAFYRTGTDGGDKIITTLKVMSGAMIGGNKRFGIATIDLNGCTLTNALTAAGPRMYLGSTVKNPGHIVQIDVKDTLQSVVSWGSATSDNVWTVATPGTDGAAISFYSNADNVVFPWTLLLESSLSLDVNADQVMSGPIVAKSGASMLKVSDNYYATHTDGRKLALQGSITGSPLIYKQTYDSSKKYDVDVTMSGERQELRSTIVECGWLTVTGGVYHALANDTGSVQVRKDAQLRIVDAGVVATTNAKVSVVNSSFATAGDKFAGKVARLELSGPVSWAKDESLPASYSAVHLGDDGTSSVVGWGAMSLDGGAVMDNNAVFVGVRGVGALTVSDGEFRHRDVGEYFCYRDRHARIGSEANAYGYAGFTNSAVTIEGGFKLGYKAASTGMMSLRGGSLDVGDSLTEIGGGGYGDFYLGNGATFRMAPKSSGWCRLVLGFEIHSEIDYGVTDLPGGTSILTVDSGASALLSRLDISPSSNRSQINLNDGGLLSVFQIFYKDPNHNRPAGGRSIISFNGGTLKCRDEWGYGKTFPQDCPDLTVVHEGGAIVDIPRYTYATNNMAFLRPTGKVFKTVTKPTDADFLASVNVGPARLVFEDAPDVDVPGEGATGFIAFDAKGKCLGDVVITSPGTGYHDGAKAYAVIPQYPNRRFECGVELAAAKGGGLTKTNGGELYLTQVNTYEGPTVVRDGFLKAMVAGAIPAGTVLRVEGGKLDLNSTVDTFETVEGTGGTLDGVKGGLIRLQRLSTAGCNGVNLGTASISVEGDWKVDAADLAAAKARGFVATYPASVDFARGSTIEISGVADALDPEAGAYELFAVGAGKTVTGLVDVTLKDDPDNMWKVKVGSKGISLVYRTGLMLIVR